MTVSSSLTRISYVGDAVSVNFAVPFGFYAGTDLLVVQNGVTMTLSSDYTVTGGLGSTGTVTMVVAPAAAVNLQIILNPPITQTVALVDGTEFPAATLNQEADRAVQISLRLNDKLTRALRAPDGPDVSALNDMPVATVRAGKYLGFDGSGQPTALSGTGNDSALRTDLATSTAGIDGARLVAYRQNGTGAIAQAVRDAMVRTVYVEDYGTNTTPGTTDMSTAMQAAIDANKGGRIIVSTQCLVAGILLSGSTYDRTKIVCAGSGELKLKADAAASNFDTSIWGGLIILSCDGVELDLRWNGNRAAMTNRESVHCVILAAATNVTIPSLTFRETRGDGLYIDRASPLNSGAGVSSSNVVVGIIRGYNTANDGRNVCSVISCDGLTIGELHGYQVGGIVAGLQMPGGLDLEPNWAAQSITDVNVGLVNVVTAGSSGCQINGKAITNDATRDWNVQRIKIGKVLLRNTDTAGTFFIRRARDVDFDASQTHSTTRGFGAFIDYADRITGKLKTKFSTRGVLIGYSDYLYDSEIQVNIDDYSIAGVSAAGFGRSKIKGRAYGASSAVATSAINLLSNTRALTQTGVIYEIDAPYDSLNAFAFYNTAGDTVAIGVGTIARNCDWTGYSNIANTFSDNASSPIPKTNIQGVSDVVSTIASVTGALTIPIGVLVFSMTGTGTVSSINATSNAGKTIKIITTAASALTDGSNLKLAGNFTASADDVITLLCDGTNYFEQSRSAN